MREHLVERLRFVGNDESGQFCEAMVITCEGKENYLMLRGRPQREGNKYVYQKMDFQSREELMKAFPGSYDGKWLDTDGQGGFSSIPFKEFVDAGIRDSKRRLSFIIKPAN
jgi:hypothetical protein